jgi:hypothetical protein
MGAATMGCFMCGSRARSRVEVAIFYEANEARSNELAVRVYRSVQVVQVTRTALGIGDTSLSASAVEQRKCERKCDRRININKLVLCVLYKGREGFIQLDQWWWPYWSLATAMSA